MNGTTDILIAASEAEARKAVEDARLMLVTVRSTLADLLREVAEGKAAALTGVVAKQAELESALRRVFEVEQKYDDWHRKQSDGAGSGEIDFDAIRVEIGCRLARLRDCCDPG